MFRWSVILMSIGLLALTPSVAAGRSLDTQCVDRSHSLAPRLSTDLSKPLFTVGIRGGFTGIQMLASVYRDGRVVTVRQGAGRSGAPVEARVPLSVSAVQKVLGWAVSSHVFAIPRSVQDAVLGADIPVLSFSIATSGGVRRVHVMGGEVSHPPGSAAFFPIWSLLDALAGYPPQVG